MIRIKEEAGSEIEQAEFHLNRDAAGRALRTLTWLAAIAGLALVTKPASAGCGPAIEQVTYSATFRWLRPETRVDQPMRLVVGTRGAQLWSGKSCLSTCQIQAWEMEAETPVALRMECKNALLGAFSTTVTVLWSEGEWPAIRFGTWLSGYEQAPLFVEKDRILRVNRAASYKISASDHKRVYPANEREYSWWHAKTHQSRY